WRNKHLCMHLYRQVDMVTRRRRITDEILFFFNDRATTEFYPLSLHAALPIGRWCPAARAPPRWGGAGLRLLLHRPASDRKSTRLNSSHITISYAVFCLQN